MTINRNKLKGLKEDATGDVFRGMEMIVVKISDGFGNQLFMYACGYAVAQRIGTELVLDTSILETNNIRKYELNNLNILYKKRLSVNQFKSRIVKIVARKLQSFFFLRNMKHYEEDKNIGFDEGILRVSDNTYISGYWQSEKYFAEYRSDLIKQLTPKEKRSTSVRYLEDDFQKCNSVAVHVRRGDYVGIGCQLDMEYYDRAIDLIKSKFPKEQMIFYIFSDDIDFCKEHFEKKDYIAGRGIEFRYPQYESDDYALDDLFLMSHCRHMIIANSSYSWWAAWLNQNKRKIVICPEIGMWRGDFYPEEWIKIKCD